MKIWYSKNSKYGRPMVKETAWKILIGIIILAAAALVANHFGIKI